MKNIGLSNEKKYIRNALTKVQDDCLKMRYSNIIGWYIKHSRINKFLYYMFAILLVVLSGILTWINLLESITIDYKIASVTLAILIFGITSINAIFRFQSNWTRFRLCAEEGKSLLSQLACESSKPLTDERKKYYLGRINSLSSSETKIWKCNIKQD